MNKICTDIEQSKKLLKMGIDPGTADMSYVVGSLIVNPPTNYGYNITAAELESKGVIPSWSLSAILDLLPKRLDNDQYYLNIDYKTLCISYTDFKDNDLMLHYVLFRVSTEPLIDAAFYMLVWLIDQGYVKTDKK